MRGIESSVLPEMNATKLMNHPTKLIHDWHRSERRVQTLNLRAMKVDIFI